MSTRRRRFTYSDRSHGSVGEMRCSICNRKIEVGEFRYYETTNAYVSQHRACTEDDPEWSARDENKAKHSQRLSELKRACEAFHAQWGIDDLSPYLTEATQ